MCICVCVYIYIVAHECIYIYIYNPTLSRTLSKAAYEILNANVRRIANSSLVSAYLRLILQGSSFNTQNESNVGW